MLEYLLMGAQASGAIGSIWSANMNYSALKRGQQLDEAQLDLRLKQERIASNEQTLYNLSQLQETLATQRALQAARGQLPGMGSSLATATKSITNFNKDVAARKLTLSFSEQQASANKAVGRIALAGKRSQMGAGIFETSIQNIPFSQLIGDISSNKQQFVSKKKGLLTGNISGDNYG